MFENVICKMVAIFILTKRQCDDKGTVKHRFRKTSNISRTLVGKKIVDHSDKVGAARSSFSAQYLASMDWTKTTARRDNEHLKFVIWCDLY